MVHILHLKIHVIETCFLSKLLFTHFKCLDLSHFLKIEFSRGHTIPFLELEFRHTTTKFQLRGTPRASPALCTSLLQQPLQWVKRNTKHIVSLLG